MFVRQSLHTRIYKEFAYRHTFIIIFIHSVRLIFPSLLLHYVNTSVRFACIVPSRTMPLWVRRGSVLRVPFVYHGVVAVASDAMYLLRL